MFFHPISYNVSTYTYDVTMSESLSAVIRAIVRQSSYSGPTVVLWHTVPSSDSHPTQDQLLSYDTRCHRPTVVLLRANCCLMTHGAIVRQSSYSGPTVVLWHTVPSSDSRPTQGQLLSYDTWCHRPTVVLLRTNCCLMTHGAIVRQSSHSGPTVVLWHTPYNYCVRFIFLIGPTRDFQKKIVSYIGARYTTNLHDFLCWLYVKLTTNCGVVCLIKISCMGIGPNFYMLVCTKLVAGQVNDIEEDKVPVYFSMSGFYMFCTLCMNKEKILPVV